MTQQQLGQPALDGPRRIPLQPGHQLSDPERHPLEQGPGELRVFLDDLVDRLGQIDRVDTVGVGDRGRRVAATGEQWDLTQGFARPTLVYQVLATVPLAHHPNAAFHQDDQPPSWITLSEQRGTGRGFPDDTAFRHCHPHYLNLMPELPEVETMVREVRPTLVGRRIKTAALSHIDVLRGVTRPKLLKALTGAKIHAVTRRAKHAVVHLDGYRFVLQPGMTGNLLIYDRPLTPDELKYAVLNTTLDNKTHFVFRDVRRLGTLLLLNDRQWKAYDEALGPEPLDPGLTPEVFEAGLRTSNQAIKKVLMDQGKIVGVGNIYANEALFTSGIDPSKPASKVSSDSYRKLYHEVRRILQAAIDSQGTTFRDYRTATGEYGNFQLELKVYERQGEPCVICGTRLAGTHDIDGRITVFCHRCQS